MWKQIWPSEKKEADTTNASGGGGEEANDDSAKQLLKKEEVLNRPLDFQRVVTYPDVLFRDTGGLPSPSDVSGTYDILFYAGDMENCMRHHRTAKGTLTHSSSSIPRDNDESKAWEVASYLVGTVDMHPGMDLLDVIPFGGDLKFEETERVQSLARTEWSRKETGIVKDENLVSPAYKQVDNSAKDVDATGVIKIKVTDTPVGMPLHGSNGMPCDYSGGGKDNSRQNSHWHYSRAARV